VRSVLMSHDARIVPTLENLEDYRHASNLIIIVPHTTHKRDTPKFPGAEVVTEWWVEACLYKRRYVQPSENFTNMPFEEFPLEGISLRTYPDFSDES
jgi:DNA replication regulator DPB11